MKRPAFQSLLAKLRPGANERLEVVGIEDDVGADRHARDQRVAQRVGAVALAPPRADRSRCRATWTSCGAACRAPCRAGTSVVNGDLAHELEPGHDHPRDPEEQDLGRGDQRVAGVERARGRRSARASRGWRTAPARRRTRCRARPRPAAPAPPQPGQAVEVGAAHADPAAALVLAVPHRDAVAPPELPGDAPVADALEPVLVVVAAALGDEPDGRRRGSAASAGRGERLHAARTTAPRAAARSRCRSGSSGPPRGGGSRPSRAGPAPRAPATTRLRASKRSSPWNRSGTARLIRASGVITSTRRRARAAGRSRSRSGRAPA